MQTNHHQLIEQAIIAIRHKKERLPSRNVKDDLIRNYEDFVREQDLLKNHYNFKQSVFNSLVNLADELWSGSKRFNRYDLLTTMKQYLARGNHKLDTSSKEKLFELLKKIFANGKASKSLAEICFLMLRDFSLSAEFETWICQLTKDYNSKTLLRRILNYPAASKTITQWVIDNFRSDAIRKNRYKAISWLINENPDYIIDNQTLIDDFEFLNTLDANNIQDFFYDKERIITFYDERSFAKRTYEEDVAFSLISRPYCSVVWREATAYDTPDFTPLRTFFADNFIHIKNQTMLWAIAVSILPTNTKVRLFKQHYSPACFWTLLNIAKRYKIVSILQWMKKQPFEEGIFCEIELDKITNPEQKLQKLMDKNSHLKEFVERLDLDVVRF